MEAKVEADVRSWLMLERFSAFFVQIFLFRTPYYVLRFFLKCDLNCCVLNKRELNYCVLNKRELNCCVLNKHELNCCVLNKRELNYCGLSQNFNEFIALITLAAVPLSPMRSVYPGRLELEFKKAKSSLHNFISSNRRRGTQTCTDLVGSLGSLQL
jgi:hypothetical protein